MPVFTTQITGSTGDGAVQLFGTIKTAGFLSGLAVGNAATINVSTTVPESYNSVLFGPITIDTDGTLTISDGAVVKIKDIEDV